MDTRDKFITMRVADGKAAVPSTMLVCERCREPVWCDVLNVEKVAAMDVEVVCNHCIMPVLVEGKATETIAMVGGEQTPLSKEDADDLAAFLIERELRR